MASMERDPLHCDPGVWLRMLEDEYLDEYVPAGGSVVKVVSGEDRQLADVRARLGCLASARGFLYAYVDPAEPGVDGKPRPLHRMDRFLCEISAKVDWRMRAVAQAREFLRLRGLEVGAGPELEPIDVIAARNGRDEVDLVADVQRNLATPQLQDYGKDVDFRTAVAALLRALILAEKGEPSLEEVLLRWFAGQTVPGGASVLKKVGVHERITPRNARSILASLLRWLPETGLQGALVLLDLRPYEVKRRPKTQIQAELVRRLGEAIDRGASQDELQAIRADYVEPAVAYSDKAYYDMLNLVRHFIDDIDRLQRLALIVFTSPRFFDRESRRNYTDYNALQTRIGLEVRDSGRPNPAAPLVHLGGAR